jgi:hypothetical protein
MKAASGSSDSLDDGIASLKAELRRELLPGVNGRLVFDKVLQLLQEQTHKPSRDELARALTGFLVQTWSLAPLEDSAVERLIENRPTELYAVVEASRRDELQKVMNLILNSPPKNKARAKPRTDEERMTNVRKAKARHERIRKDITIRPGLIEKEFSEAPVAISNPYGSIILFGTSTGQGALPGGPCLDDIFIGGEVRMSIGVYSLENLFGRSRKLLPTALPSRRVGRKLFYGHQAVLKCIEGLLAEKNRRSPWLLDPNVRESVLVALLDRARRLATPDILDGFEAAIRDHLP